MLLTNFISQRRTSLDLVIARASDDFLNNIRVSDPAISDHSAVHCHGCLLESRILCDDRYLIENCGLLIWESFVRDIENSALMNYETFDNASDLAVCYDRTLSALLELNMHLSRNVL